MKIIKDRRGARRSRYIAIVAVVALAVGALPALAHSGAAPTLLARGAFADDVDLKIKVKLEGEGTRVVSVDGPSKVATVRVDVPVHGQMGWHTHPGPVIVTVASGELTYVNASDCEPRVYEAGEVFVDPGQGNVHMAWASDGAAVLYATFFDAEGPLTIPAEGPDDCQPHV